MMTIISHLMDYLSIWIIRPSINLANAKQKQRIHSCIKIKSMFRTTVMSVLTCQVLDKCGLSFVSRFRIKVRWNLYLVDTFGTFPTVRLIEGVCLIEVVKIAQCLLTINIQWLLCSEVKLNVVKEAIRVQVHYLSLPT